MGLRTLSATGKKIVKFVAWYNGQRYHEGIWRVCAITFVIKPLSSLAALTLIIRYPVTKALIEKMWTEAKVLLTDD